MCITSQIPSIHVFAYVTLGLQITAVAMRKIKAHKATFLRYFLDRVSFHQTPAAWGPHSLFLPSTNSRASLDPLEFQRHRFLNMKILPSIHWILSCSPLSIPQTPSVTLEYEKNSHYDTGIWKKICRFFYRLPQKKMLVVHNLETEHTLQTAHILNLVHFVSKSAATIIIVWDSL